MTAFTLNIAEPRLGARPLLTDLTVTNGIGRVTLGLLPDGGDDRDEHISLTPSEAVALAVALLNAARNVEVGTHGSDPQAVYDHPPRALAILTDHVPPAGA